MTGAEHYQRAADLAAQFDADEGGLDSREVLALAQAHAMLGLGLTLAMLVDVVTEDADAGKPWTEPGQTSGTA